MISRTISARPRTWALASLAAIVLLPGCMATRGGDSTGRHDPPRGVVDAHQPRELQMVSMPRYVVEPPDELEISVRPATLEIPLTTTIVTSDGNVDLGFYGDVYVAGLTLDDVELKIAQHLTASPEGRKIRGPIQASVRLVNGTQSKSYYVMGAVTTQGKFPIIGNELVLDAILSAGLRANSMPEKAYLVRPHPAGAADQILRIDWEGIKERGDTLTNYQLFPGDRIVVPGGKPPGLLGSLLGG